MARKLKVYRTSIGFFELAVAAPSMKAAAEAWGSDPDIFRRGFAEETDDAKVVEAAMAAPGVVLRRPVGSHGQFGEQAALPKAPEEGRKKSENRPERAEPGKKSGAKDDEKAKQAATREREREREALERQRKEVAEREKREAAERERARKERERMIAKANADFEKARGRHDEAVETLKQRREELDKDEAREKERWEAEQRRHRDALNELGS
jgi:colicin import membrane protein